VFGFEKTFDRRFAQEKKEQETRHQGEVTRLNQLMKTANQENLAKMKGSFCCKFSNFSFCS
jgi:hypothetical protein